MNRRLGNCELVNREFVFLFFLNRKGRKGLRKGRKGKADYELYVMSYKLIGNENQQPTTENQKPFRLYDFITYFLNRTSYNLLSS